MLKLRRAFATFRPSYGVFIDGKEYFPENSTFFDVESPATSKILCNIVAADTTTVNRAIKNADDVFKNGTWSKIDVRERAKVLNQIAINLRSNIPRLANLEVAQTGRAVREMNAQVFNFFIATIVF
jgi:acyl-CoA reductase-like NAD-dependent aldehyde dehydrogenase